MVTKAGKWRDRANYEDLLESRRRKSKDVKGYFEHSQKMNLIQDRVVRLRMYAVHTRMGLAIDYSKIPDESYIRYCAHCGSVIDFALHEAEHIVDTMMLVDHLGDDRWSCDGCTKKGLGNAKESMAREKAARNRFLRRPGNSRDESVQDSAPCVSGEDGGVGRPGDGGEEIRSSA